MVQVKAQVKVQALQVLEKVLQVLWLALLVVLIPLAVVWAILLAMAPATVLVLGLLGLAAYRTVQRAVKGMESESE
jgi:hypothetical protein